MIEVCRFEKKYGISKIESGILKKKLEMIMKRDKYNEKNKYKVKSLYFDSIYDKDFYDKQNGIEDRKKIRIRFYDENTKFLKLEIKEKLNEVSRKKSIVIDKEIAIALIKQRYDVLKKIDNPVAEKIYFIMQCGYYKPKCMIEYTREAFYLKENNIRITIDSDIKATETNLDIFSEKRSLYPSLIKGDVLEVKYSNFLVSYIKNILDSVSKQEVSVSKYANSRLLNWG